MTYDFHQLLDWMDFQNLARDIVQIRDNILLESFKEGKDRGIDGRFCNTEGTTILQAKRYGEFRTIKQKLEVELVKVKRLTPQRYILVMSIELSVDQKDEIMQMFQPYIKTSGDIITSDDLNNYLNHSDYKEVVRNYPKLWAASGVVLQELVRDVMYSSVVMESREQLRTMKETRKTFVATSIYEDAMKQLEKNQYVVISGQPGAGKSTIAKMLVLYFTEVQGFEEFSWTTSSVEKIMNLYDPNRKQVFVIDDIWGRVFYAEQRHDQEMSCLERLLQWIENDKNKVVIITTREYIYQQATAKYAVLRSSLDQFKLVCDIDIYTDAEKARILFSHLYHSALPYKYIWSIYFKAEHIVNMHDYNPRVIGLFLKQNNPWNYTAKEFTESFLKYIQNPFLFWEDVFNGLTDEAKLLLLLTFISQGESEPAGLKDLEYAYYHCLNGKNQVIDHVATYMKCVSELEKTMIEVYEYYSNSDEQVVRLRTPAVEDFLRKFLQENINHYGPILLNCVCYLNQLVFLMDKDKIILPDKLYDDALHLFIESNISLPFSWPFQAEENYLFETEDYMQQSMLYRCALLLNLHEKRPRQGSFTYIETLIRFCRNILTSGRALSYGDMMVYPGLVSRCVKIGIPFKNKENIVQEYFKQCSLVTLLYDNGFWKIISQRNKRTYNTKENLV